MGNVLWDGMRWDRHKLLWDGNGTDKYVSWSTLLIGRRQIEKPFISNHKQFVLCNFKVEFLIQGQNLYEKYKSLK